MRFSARSPFVGRATGAGQRPRVAPQRISFTAHGWKAVALDLLAALHAENRCVDASELYVFTMFRNVVQR